VVIWSQIEIPDHFSTSLTTVELEILDLVACLIQSPATLGEMIDSWQVN